MRQLLFVRRYSGGGAEGGRTQTPAGGSATPAGAAQVDPTFSAGIHSHVEGSPGPPPPALQRWYFFIPSPCEPVSVVGSAGPQGPSSACDLKPDVMGGRIRTPRDSGACWKEERLSSQISPRSVQL